jgi:hypothetical protein
LEWVKEYIDESSPYWIETLSRISFAVFPSLEEGIPATVGELVNSGIPVLYSNYCGLNFPSDVEYFEAENRAQNLALFSEFLKKSRDELDGMLKSQKNYLNSLTNTKSQFEEIFKRLDFNSKALSNPSDNAYCEIDWPDQEQQSTLTLQILGDSVDMKSVVQLINDAFRTHGCVNQIVALKDGRLVKAYSRIQGRRCNESKQLKLDVDLNPKVKSNLELFYLCIALLLKARAALSVKVLKSRSSIKFTLNNHSSRK